MPQALTADLGPPKYRWTPERFLRAWEAGVFEGQRVELLDGEVVPVHIGPWHGRTTGLAFDLLPGLSSGAVKTNESLLSGESLPDPDLWLCRAGAQPKESHGERLVRWDPDDVLLVVEISDETKTVDLTLKARLYGSSGYAEYWVIAKEAVYLHRQPSATGYDLRVTYHPGQQIPVPYAPGETVDVGALLGA